MATGTKNHTPRLNLRATWERQGSVTTDADGREQQNWSNLGTFWAGLRALDSFERENLNATWPSAEGVMTLRANPMTRKIHEKDRMVINGVPWDIENVRLMPNPTRPIYVTLLVSQRPPGA